MKIDDGITLRKLLVFRAFMRYGTLGKVAEALDLSTVSVHRALHSLENAVGCILFARQGRNLVALETAHVFATYAQRSLEECERGIKRVRDLAGVTSPSLQLGCLYSLTLQCIPQLIIRMKLRQPQLEIQLKMGSNRDLLHDLESGVLDAIVIGTMDDASQPGLLHVPLLHDTLYFAAPAGSPYASMPAIELAQLKHESFVGLSEGFVTAQGVQQAFSHAGFTPHIAVEVHDIFSLINLVVQGVGYSLLPGRVRDFSSRIQLVPLTHPYQVSHTIGLLLSQDRAQEPGLAGLIEECRNM